jgi:hypothetical protein
VEFFCASSPEKKIVAHLAGTFLDRGFCSLGFALDAPRPAIERNPAFAGQIFDEALIFFCVAGPELMIEMSQTQFPTILRMKRLQEMKKRNRIRSARTSDEDLLTRFEKSPVPEMFFKTGKKTLRSLDHAIP